MHTSPTHLDGNAAAGPMSDLLAFDITAAVGRCAGCQGRSVIAEGLAYVGGPGMVLRCPACDHVLLRLVAREDRAWLDLSGLAYLEIDRSEAAPGWP